MTIDNSLFEGNNATEGGAIRTEGFVQNTELHVRNCVFKANEASTGAAVCGGGSFTGCRFSENFSTGFDMGGEGGATVMAESNLLLLRCVFNGNRDCNCSGALRIDRGGACMHACMHAYMS